MKTDSKDKSIGIILFDVNHKEYLIIKHKKGHWGFPKGHQDGNELFIETAFREISEEVGIRKEDIEIDENILFYDNYSFYSQDKYITKEVIYFLGYTNKNLFNIILEEEEIYSYSWLQFKPAYDVLNFSETKSVLRKVNLYLINANINIRS